MSSGKMSVGRSGKVKRNFFTIDKKYKLLEKDDHSWKARLAKEFIISVVLNMSR